MRTIKIFTFSLLAISLTLLASCTKDEPTVQETAPLQLENEFVLPPISSFTDTNVFEEWDLSENAYAFLESDLASDLTEEEIEIISRGSTAILFRQDDLIAIQAETYETPDKTTLIEVTGESVALGTSYFDGYRYSSVMLFHDLYDMETQQQSVVQVLASEDYEMLLKDDPRYRSTDSAFHLNRTRLITAGGNGLFEGSKGSLSRVVLYADQITEDILNSETFGPVITVVSNRGWISI